MIRLNKINYYLFYSTSRPMGVWPDHAVHRNCANGVCISCYADSCQDGNSIRARRALDGSYYRSCNNGECVECENRDCKYSSHQQLIKN
ncbi:hypothetical protein PRIPAC_88278 [Pristionchus pacificus]|uniref:Uncharacterized protein n=1 Tax=Pristionchus pacificus TaxID=54126 RepID=A0A2A6B708_PRIPA|nr:hypothetical protein PRIPAC_88278 [Pristionchus pacificus]|eukprot:PDM61633.1 hypothetical protein PRIPAC_51075 [Pristionchus pacificus]